MKDGNFKRGEVVVANLNPTKGSEQAWLRPVLIIQRSILTANSPTTIIAPITSKIYTKEYPTNVQFFSKESGLKKESTVLLNQIRTIDKRRISRKIGFIPGDIMKKVDLALKISLELD